MRGLEAPKGLHVNHLRFYHFHFFRWHIDCSLSSSPIVFVGLETEMRTVEAGCKRFNVDDSFCCLVHFLCVPLRQ